MACALILDAMRGITLVNTNWAVGTGFQAIDNSKLSYETTLGIVGFGIIGKKVMKKTKWF